MKHLSAVTTVAVVAIVLNTVVLRTGSAQAVEITWPEPKARNLRL